MMPNYPLISVIIPFYKGEKYLRQCLYSVLGQPYENIEIILINDGSPTGADLCAQLASEESRIKYFEQQNMGIGATRNKGISLATGKYIACLDQDDMWVKGFLDEKTVADLDSNIDILSYDVLSCNEKMTLANLETADTRFFSGGTAAAQNGSFHHSAHFFRRAFLVENNIGYALTRHEDIIFMHKCYYLAKEIMHIKKPMLLYRNNPSSETHRQQPCEELYVPILHSWMDFLAWFQQEYPEDSEIQAWCKHMICVYGIEGIEALYQSGRSEIEICDIFENYPCRSLLDDYENIMLSNNRIQQIGEFYKNRKHFAAKNRRRGMQSRVKQAMKTLYVFRKMYYRRKYPLCLEQTLVCR